MAATATSFLRGKLLKLLVMACKIADLMSKVDALPFMPFQCNVFTQVHASKALDTEIGKIMKDKELVDFSECHESFFCYLQLFLDLCLQLLPPLDLISCS